MPPARIPGRDARLRHCYRTRSAATIEAMNAVNRLRPLTEAEVTELICAIRQERENELRRVKACGKTVDKPRARDGDGASSGA